MTRSERNHIGRIATGMLRKTDFYKKKVTVAKQRRSAALRSQQLLDRYLQRKRHQQPPPLTEPRLVKKP
jgi:hypothetical protein